MRRSLHFEMAPSQAYRLLLETDYLQPRDPCGELIGNRGSAFQLRMGIR
ncbi:MAG: hypothetical protein ACLR1R_10070 [Ruminococcus callidus]